MNRILLLLMIASLATGCRKPLPSPDFIEASGKYTSLLAVDGDSAYEGAQMAAVVAQLGRVTEKSSDFAAAQTLIATIATETARAAADKVAKAKLANAPVPMPQNPTSPVAVAPAAEPPPAVVVEKKNEDPYAVEVGATWAPLTRQFVGCLSSRGPLTLTRPDGGEAKQTEAFELVDKPDCKKRIPALVDKLSIVYDGKILNILPKGAMVMTTVLNPMPAQPAPAPAPAPPPAPKPPEEPPAPAADKNGPIKY